MDFDKESDQRIREEAFNWLQEQVSLYDETLPREILAQGFQLDGQRVPLLGPQGIFKPSVMQVPLSITTSPNGPYDDSMGPDDLIRYRYRGTDPNHRDNVGLRFAMDHGLPLVYFQGLIPGRYWALWPVYITGDAIEELTFTVSADEQESMNASATSELEDPHSTEERRRYHTRWSRTRMHQAAFRQRVISAYGSQCALCGLPYEALLDAAHIIPDNEPSGEPIVTNGLALCRLHHAAFDRYFLGVRPDYIIEIRPDVLEDSDGPTLQYAIQALHGQSIFLPQSAVQHPSTESLSVRYKRFLEVAAANNIDPN